MRPYLWRAAERAGLAGQRLTGGVALRRRRALVGGGGGASGDVALVVVLDEAQRDGLPGGVGAVGQGRVFGDLDLVVRGELDDLASRIQRVRGRRRRVRIQLLKGGDPARFLLQAAVTAQRAVLQLLRLLGVVPTAALGARRARHVHVHEDVLGERPAAAAGLSRVQDQWFWFLQDAGDDGGRDDIGWGQTEGVGILGAGGGASLGQAALHMLVQHVLQLVGQLHTVTGNQTV